MPSTHRPVPSPASLIQRLSVTTLSILLLAGSPAVAKSTPPPLPASGDVLIAGGVGSDGKVTTQAEFYSVSFGQFVTTGATTTARASHQAEVMFDTAESEINNDVGDIVLIGGFSGSAKRTGPSLGFNIFALNTFELYDPKTGTFSAPSLMTAQVMTNPRAFTPIIDVPAGAPHIEGHFVAIAGLCNAPDLDSCRTSDVIHPDEHVTNTSNPLVGRMIHTATLLHDETTILVTGGFADLSGTALASAEILDTNTDDFIATPNMNAARSGQTATVLIDGTVLIAGAVDATGAALKSAEIFDPVAVTFTPVASPMHDKRAWYTATLLSDGMVLLTDGFKGGGTFALTGAGTGVTGSWTAPQRGVLATAEIYDPIAKTFTCVHGAINAIKKTGSCKVSMRAPRMDQTATALADGDVLIAGGFGSAMKSVSSAELFHGGKFIRTGSMKTARAWHSAVALP
jgi:hypothetical protein